MASRFEELRSLPNSVQLIDSIYTTLEFACVWGDSFFIDEEATTQLYFELLRTAGIIRKLAQLSRAPITSSSGRPRPVPTPCISAKNIVIVIDHFEAHITKHRTETGDLFDASEVLAVIRKTSDSLDIADHPALEDIPRYSQSEHEAFFKNLLREASADALQLGYAACNRS